MRRQTWFLVFDRRRDFTVSSFRAVRPSFRLISPGVTDAFVRSMSDAMGAGQADTAGNSTAENLGTFPSNGAVHDGTSTPALDVSQGLVSALGGQDVHPLEFAGAEIMPAVSGLR